MYTLIDDKSLFRAHIIIYQSPMDIDTVRSSSSVCKQNQKPNKWCYIKMKRCDIGSTSIESWTQNEMSCCGEDIYSTAGNTDSERCVKCSSNKYLISIWFEFINFSWRATSIVLEFWDFPSRIRIFKFVDIFFYFEGNKSIISIEQVRYLQRRQFKTYG